MNYKNIPLNAKPSLPDNRDYPIGRLIATTNVFADDFFVPYHHKIKNQGMVGSCVSHSLSYCREVVEEKQHNKYIEFSNGFVYANREATDFQGEGMRPREALSSLKNYGIVEMDVFPYNDVFPMVRNRFLEHKDIYIEKASPYKISSYCRIYNDYEIKNALTHLGPVTACIPIYMSFYMDDKGVIKNPEPSERLLGYHEVTLLGWKKIQNKEYKIFINSFGDLWGDKGFGYLPNNYEITEAWSITDNILPHPEEDPIKQKYWRVQVGAFAVKANCDRLQEELKRKGLATYAVFVDNLYKVQLGAFSIKDNAIKKQNEVKAMGYSTFLTYY